MDHEDQALTRAEEIDPALLQMAADIYGHALPHDAPGAWIRAAFDRMFDTTRLRATMGPLEPATGSPEPAVEDAHQHGAEAAKRDHEEREDEQQEQ